MFLTTDILLQLQKPNVSQDLCLPKAERIVMYTFRANAQTLLALAWLASQEQCRKEVISYQKADIFERRLDCQKMITELLEGELGPLGLGYGHMCASTLTRLLQHQYARIEMDFLEWALFGKNAVYFEPDALPRTPDHAKDELAARPETEVFLAALRSHEDLQAYLCGALQTGFVDASTEENRGVLFLHTFFVETAEVLVPLSPGKFLVPELLRLSFEHIDWEAVLAYLLKG
jgi:hypothetical protein